MRWLDRGSTIRKQTGMPWIVLHHLPAKTGSGVSGEESRFCRGAVLVGRLSLENLLELRQDCFYSSTAAPMTDIASHQVLLRVGVSGVMFQVSIRIFQSSPCRISIVAQKPFI
jgi:hypothetical protein